MAERATDWQYALALLDAGLALPAGERSVWLAQKEAERPQAAKLLQRLLEAHGRVHQENLLATLPGWHGPSAALGHTATTDAGRPGLRLGPFELIEPLGRGGMGSVWRARYADGRLRREVAVKLPSASDDPVALNTLRERLVRERDFLAQLEHPHIARVYDAGVSDDGQPFLAMEYVEGRPIDDYADAARLTIAQRLALFLQVLDAVAFAHQRMVLHRDLKPGNVLVTADGQVRLLDFGIARLLPTTTIAEHGPGLQSGQIPSVAASALGADHMNPGDTGLTGQAGRVYTLAYAAPEQVLGATLSAATDVYALGVMLYRLLTGLSPYEPNGRSRAALADAVCHAPAQPASVRAFEPPALAARQVTAPALRRALGGDLGLILQKTLAKQPEERYAGVDALAADLRRLLERHPVQARPASWAYQLERFVARHRLGVGVGTAAVAALAISTGLAVHQAGVSHEMGELARREAAQALASQRFFSRLLSSADPENSRATGSADRRSLDGALEAAERELAGTPKTLALVLKQLGELYIRIGVPDKNLEVQKKRVALLAQMPDAAVDDRVDAQVEWARALGESSVAAERLQGLPRAQEAVELATRQHASAAILVSALCLLSDRHLANSAPKEAFLVAERAVAAAQGADPGQQGALSLALATLGIASARLGKFEEARASFQRSLALDVSGAGRDKVEQLHTRTLFAEAEFEAGRYLEARREALTVLETAAADLGHMEDTLLRARMRVVLSALALGQPREAAAAAQRLLAEDLVAEDPIRAGIANLTLGMAEMANGWMVRAWSAFAVAEPALQASAVWTAKLRTQQAEWLLLNRRPAEAEAMVRSTLTRARDKNLVERDTYARAFERGGIAHARSGRLVEARRDFDSACLGPRGRLPPSHPDRIRCESYSLMVAEGLSMKERETALLDQHEQLQASGLGNSALARSLIEAVTQLKSNPGHQAFVLDLPLLS